MSHNIRRANARGWRGGGEMVNIDNDEGLGGGGVPLAAVMMQQDSVSLESEDSRSIHSADSDANPAQFKGWRRPGAAAATLSNPPLDNRPYVGSTSGDVTVTHRHVPSLVDLCCELIGANMSFEVIDRFAQPVPDDLQVRIASYAFPRREEDIQLYACLSNGSNDEYIKGQTIFNSGRVTKVVQVGFHLSGLVRQFNRSPMPNNAVNSPNAHPTELSTEVGDNVEPSFVPQRVREFLRGLDTHRHHYDEGDEHRQGTSAGVDFAGAAPQRPGASAANSYVTVSVGFDRGMITSVCCGGAACTRPWCSHVVALCLHRIQQGIYEAYIDSYVPPRNARPGDSQDDDGSGGKPSVDATRKRGFDAHFLEEAARFDRASKCTPLSDSLNRLNKKQLHQFALYFISSLHPRSIAIAQAIIDRLTSKHQPSTGGDPVVLSSYLGGDSVVLPPFGDSDGAPDPTTGAPAGESAAWCLDEAPLKRHIGRALDKLISHNTATVDPSRMNEQQSNAISEERKALVSAIRSRPPEVEGLANLLMMCREMVCRHDSNAFQLLELVTMGILDREQYQKCWFEVCNLYRLSMARQMESPETNAELRLTDASKATARALLVNNAAMQSGVQTDRTAVQIPAAVTTLCEQVLTLWMLMALNPTMSRDSRLALYSHLVDRDRTLREMLHTQMEFNVNQTGVERFHAFRPAIKACLISLPASSWPTMPSLGAVLHRIRHSLSHTGATGPGTVLVWVHTAPYRSYGPEFKVPPEDEVDGEGDDRRVSFELALWWARALHAHGRLNDALPLAVDLSRFLLGVPRCLRFVLRPPPFARPCYDSGANCHRQQSEDVDLASPAELELANGRALLAKLPPYRYYNGKTQPPDESFCVESEKDEQRTTCDLQAKLVLESIVELVKILMQGVNTVYKEVESNPVNFDDVDSDGRSPHHELIILVVQLCIAGLDINRRSSIGGKFEEVQWETSLSELRDTFKSALLYGVVWSPSSLHGTRSAVLAVTLAAIQRICSNCPSRSFMSKVQPPVYLVAACYETFRYEVAWQPVDIGLQPVACTPEEKLKHERAMNPNLLMALNEVAGNIIFRACLKVLSAEYYVKLKNLLSSPELVRQLPVNRATGEPIIPIALAESHNPMLHECVRRQKGELALFMLNINREFPSAVSDVLTALFCQSYNDIMSPNDQRTDEQANRNAARINSIQPLMVSPISDPAIAANQETIDPGESSASAFEDEYSDASVRLKRLSLAAPKRPSHGLARIDSSAPETASSDNSPQMTRRGNVKQAAAVAQAALRALEPSEGEEQKGATPDDDSKPPPLLPAMSSLDDGSESAVDNDSVADLSLSDVNDTNNRVTSPTRPLLPAEDTSLSVPDGSQAMTRSEQALGEFLVPTFGQPTSSQSDYMFELAQSVMNAAGGVSTQHFFPAVRNPNRPHRHLHMAAFRLGLHCLWLKNQSTADASGWYARKYNRTVSWLHEQAIEIGPDSLRMLQTRELWKEHFVPSEVAELADRAVQQDRFAECAVELAMSTLAHSDCLQNKDVQRVLEMCAKHSTATLERALDAVEACCLRVRAMKQHYEERMKRHLDQATMTASSSSQVPVNFNPAMTPNFQPVLFDVLFTVMRHYEKLDENANEHEARLQILSRSQQLHAGIPVQQPAQNVQLSQHQQQQQQPLLLPQQSFDNSQQQQQALVMQQQAQQQQQSNWQAMFQQNATNMLRPQIPISTTTQQQQPIPQQQQQQYAQLMFQQMRHQAPPPSVSPMTHQMQQQLINQFNQYGVNAGLPFIGAQTTLIRPGVPPPPLAGGGYPFAAQRMVHYFPHSYPFHSQQQQQQQQQQQFVRASTPPHLVQQPAAAMYAQANGQPSTSQQQQQQPQPIAQHHVQLPPPSTYLIKAITVGLMALEAVHQAADNARSRHHHQTVHACFGHIYNPYQPVLTPAQQTLAKQRQKEAGVPFPDDDLITHLIQDGLSDSKQALVESNVRNPLKPHPKQTTHLEVTTFNRRTLHTLVKRMTAAQFLPHPTDMGGQILAPKTLKRSGEKSGDDRSRSLFDQLRMPSYVDSVRLLLRCAERAGVDYVLVVANALTGDRVFNAHVLKLAYENVLEYVTRVQLEAVGSGGGNGGAQAPTVIAQARANSPAFQQLRNYVLHQLYNRAVQSFRNIINAGLNLPYAGGKGSGCHSGKGKNSPSSTQLSGPNCSVFVDFVMQLYELTLRPPSGCPPDAAAGSSEIMDEILSSVKKARNTKKDVHTELQRRLDQRLQLHSNFERN